MIYTTQITVGLTEKQKQWLDNHRECYTPASTFYRELLINLGMPDEDGKTRHGPQIQALEELQKVNPLRSDLDAYRYALTEWALGAAWTEGEAGKRKPTKGDFGLVPYQV